MSCVNPEHAAKQSIFATLSQILMRLTAAAIARWLPVCAFAIALALGLEAGELRITVRETGSPQPIPVRLHVLDAAGKPLKPPGLPSWNDHFVCTGAVVLALAPGKYRVEAERGPEFTAATATFEVGEDPRPLDLEIKRLTDLRREGWWSGETHVHRATEDARLLLAAEDLQLGQFLTWWNKVNPWSMLPLPVSLPVTLPDGRCHNPMGGEDERDGGALLFLDLPEPLSITEATRHYPSSLVFARQARARGARWIDAEKPFWWDFPMWVAHGVVDSVGIAHNHMQRSGVLDNEAWGRPRDLQRYPGPQGNGRYTQDIYYHLLNGGIRLPPSAGSASGVLPNPVGYNRAYVHLDAGFSYHGWMDGLRAGRSFVSNGPLLRARANGLLPGAILRTNGTLHIHLEAQIDSRDPIEAVEWVHNGHIQRVSLPARLAVAESGWFLLRATASTTNTFRFASTAPWYVELDGRPMTPRAASARFFSDWCKERISRLDALTQVSAGQREELLQPWREALGFWQARETAAARRTPVPDKLVALTFDDSVASHYHVARPVLKRYGFGATFFITEGFSFRTNKTDYMTWPQIRQLHDDGFEIGNHTRDHWSVTADTAGRLPEQLEAIAARCREHGIPTPISFAWPGNAFHTNALPLLRAAGIRFARRGGEPEVPYKLGGGIPYSPDEDHPLLIPSAGDGRPDWTLEDLKRAVAPARAGRIAVLQFHGVPEGEHPWVNTPRERFEEYMAWLHAEGFKVVALRDLARYVDPDFEPPPLAAIERRRRAQADSPH